MISKNIIGKICVYLPIRDAFRVCTLDKDLYLKIWGNENSYFWKERCACDYPNSSQTQPRGNQSFLNFYKGLYATGIVYGWGYDMYDPFDPSPPKIDQRAKIFVGARQIVSSMGWTAILDQDYCLWVCGLNYKGHLGLVKNKVKTLTCVQANVKNIFSSLSTLIFEDANSDLCEFVEIGNQVIVCKIWTHGQILDVKFQDKYLYVLCDNGQLYKGLKVSGQYQFTLVKDTYNFISISGVDTVGYKSTASQYNRIRYLALVTSDNNLFIWSEPHQTNETMYHICDNVASVASTQDYIFYQTITNEVYYILIRNFNTGTIKHIPLLNNVRKIRAGRDCCALITTDNTLYLTGENDLGQFPPNEDVDQLSSDEEDDNMGLQGRIEPMRMVETKNEFVLPLKIADNVRDVSCGHIHSLMLVYND